MPKKEEKRGIDYSCLFSVVVIGMVPVREDKGIYFLANRQKNEYLWKP